MVKAFSCNKFKQRKFPGLGWVGGGGGGGEADWKGNKNPFCRILTGGQPMPGFLVTHKNTRSQTWPKWTQCPSYVPLSTE